MANTEHKETKGCTSSANSPKFTRRAWFQEVGRRGAIAVPTAAALLAAIESRRAFAQSDEDLSPPPEADPTGVSDGSQDASEIDIFNTMPEVSQDLLDAAGIDRESLSYQRLIIPNKSGTDSERYWVWDDFTRQSRPRFVSYFKDGEWKWKKAGLKDFGDLINLRIGGNISNEQFYKAKYRSILQDDFENLTVSQGLYWRWLEPSRGEMDKYSLRDTRQQLALANYFGQKGQKPIITGAHIFFPSTYPVWLNDLSPEECEKVMQDRVNSLIGMYPGIDRWVVVNEPYANVDLPGLKFTRDDVLYRKLGPDYLKKAFEMARQKGGPDKVLIYNDLANHSFNPKNAYNNNGFYSKTTLENLKKLTGLVDILGMQMHVDASAPPTKEEIVEAMGAYAQYVKMGVEVTEFDIDLSKLPQDMPMDQKLQLQSQIGQTVLRACLESGVCKGLSFWDIGDSNSWLEIAPPPGYGGKNADPTLFDDALEPKPFYNDLAQLTYTSAIANAQANNLFISNIP